MHFWRLADEVSLDRGEFPDGSLGRLLARVPCDRVPAGSAQPTAPRARHAGRAADWPLPAACATVL